MHVVEEREYRPLANPNMRQKIIINIKIQYEPGQKYNLTSAHSQKKKTT